MENYNQYIPRLLKQVHPYLGLTSEAKETLNLILNALVIELTNQSIDLLRPKNYKNPGKKLSETKTLSTKTMETSTLLLLTRELAKHAISEGKKAVRNFKSFKKEKDIKTTKADKAKLQLSVSKTENVIRAHLLKTENLSTETSFFTTAVVEYICAELLELSGNACKDEKRQRIKTIDIKKAVINDTELESLIRTLNISLPGVRPAILKKNKYISSSLKLPIL